MNRKNKLYYAKVLRYFFNGLLIVVPIAITFYIITQILAWLDSRLPIDWFPGSGILFLVLIITAVGYFGSTLIARPFKRAANDILDRIPLIKTLYTSITDLLSAFVGQKKRFNKPVLVKLSDTSNLEKMGFITDEDLSDLGIEDDGKVAVYMPHSYNFSGNLFVVSKSAITPITKNAAEVMKYIVSGGVTEVKENLNEKLQD